MQVYQGYKYEGYGSGGQQAQGTSRKELERRFDESHRSAPAQKPSRNWTPFVVAGLTIAVAFVCLGAWLFGYDMLVPIMAMNLVLTGGYVGWRMI